MNDIASLIERIDIVLDNGGDERPLLRDIKAALSRLSVSPVPNKIGYEQITAAQQELYKQGRWLPAPVVRAALEAALSGKDSTNE